MRKFTENTYSSPLNDTESLTLAPLIESFWEAYVNQENLEQAATKLKEEFQTLQQVPSELQNQMTNEKFLQEIAPNLEKLEIYGETGEVAVNYVVAKQNGTSEEEENYQEEFVRLFNRSEAIPQKMGQGVIKSFLIESALMMAPLEHTLEPSIEEFNQAIGEDHFEQAAEKLIEEFESLQEIAAETRENFDDERFVETIEPYLQNLTTYGEAGDVAVKYVMAKEANQSDEARDYKNQLKALLIQAYKVPQKVGGKVIKPFLIDVMWDDLNVIEYYELDGVNTSRGGGELIQYTPDHGDSTRTNNWGYEVTIENGIVVKRGGNDSKIPENGYVLSIHGSDWLRDYAELGMEVQIEDGIVLIIDPTTEVATVSEMIELVEQYEADDAISDSKVARALKIHLMAVKRYADTDQAAKVVKHMRGFETLLDYHHNNDALTDKAYTTLKEGTKAIVDKWE